jgi:hypothetical protein
VPSCNSGTSHAAKQNRRVRAGLDSAYNPYWSMVNPTELGIAGHSYGAAGVSYIGQWDPRVKAIVAWDNLAAPDPNRPTGASDGGPEDQGCVDSKDRTVAPITKANCARIRPDMSAGRASRGCQVRAWAPGWGRRILKPRTTFEPILVAVGPKGRFPRPRSVIMNI